LTAYDFAEKAHQGQLRPSGEPYIEHDMAVAQIICELKLDGTSIALALLHDILLPHTGITEARVRHHFGKEMASMVAGLHHIQSFTHDQSHQLNGNTQTLESLRSAILFTIEKDIRALMVRLADCLADLRTAGPLERSQQLVLAAEAQNLYAPLANRLGIWQLKWEMEDLAFRFLEPGKYKELARNLAEKRTERIRKVDSAVKRLRDAIAAKGIKAEVSGRSKHIYSIYRKMQRKELDLDGIYDIQALRVIIQPMGNKAQGGRQLTGEDYSLCYQVLGAVHGLWQPIPQEFDDYIANPKANGYRSLHTAVYDDETGQQLEVQIRTGHMHEEAERGVAAHWAYKEGEVNVSSASQKRIKELRELLNDLLSDSDDNLAEANQLEDEVSVNHIYVFTPKGELINLPDGSTPIDFAYQIHSEVGHHCQGARVNQKMVTLDYKLRQGDKVEIITNKRAKPSRDWMRASLGYAFRARTRSKIRQWFREQNRDENIAYGREAVERELRRLGLQESFTVADIAQALKIDDIDTFLAQVGFGDITNAQIGGALALMKRDLREDDELRPLLDLKLHQPRQPKGLNVKGVSGLHTRMAGCCNPIPPEPIVGYITRGQGITIHRADCPEVQLLQATEKDRVLEGVNWGSEQERHPIPIVVTAYRRSGLIDEMVSVLRGRGIATPKTKSLTEGNLLRIYLVAEVSTIDDLEWLMKKFENLPNVIEVRRQRWN
ncbi:MAG: bifunctional (p)ppGpp synthetase/guanosine-3',5'-bis(diphosphate) 3'-pyrophosphohydrolase, partial [Anaerolineales bacterium]|nr:bifunctional (p)ppGpp synthetase/guanosine-3',5'-bis(diphosphate) 3'-pyrophosphohydrolase [Anaerolineales bacterium]